MLLSLASLVAAAAGGPTAAGADGPARFGQYYSGPPCLASQVDRTWSQFQVNLGADLTLIAGQLMATTAGGAILVGRDDRALELLTNASRADWLLDYPLLDGGVGVWGRQIGRASCRERV